jgi:hypothetical protein
MRRVAVAMPLVFERRGVAVDSRLVVLSILPASPSAAKPRRQTVGMPPVTKLCVSSCRSVKAKNLRKNIEKSGASKTLRIHGFTGD